MLILLAFLCFVLAWIFTLAGAPHEAVLQPTALLYLGLALWVLSGLVPWAPWPRQG
jgi:hypothetical protein